MNKNKILPNLDSNKALYQYMHDFGIKNPFQTDTSEIKKVFLHVINDYKQDRISLEQFLELIASFWNTEDEPELKEVRDLVVSAEHIELNIGNYKESDKDREKEGLQEFFDYLDANS